jgi:hypothetical protein
MRRTIDIPGVSPIVVKLVHLRHDLENHIQEFYRRKGFEFPPVDPLLVQLLERRDALDARIQAVDAGRPLTRHAFDAAVMDLVAAETQPLIHGLLTYDSDDSSLEAWARGVDALLQEVRHAE